MDNKGEIAKARRIVRDLDNILGVLEDDGVFGEYNHQGTQALIDSVLRARSCASNILLSFSDETAFKTTPEKRVSLKYK